MSSKSGRSHHGHRAAKHRSGSRSRSRSRSPKHRSIKQERHNRDYEKYEYPRGREHRSSRDRGPSESRKQGRHREERHRRGGEAAEEEPRRERTSSRWEDRDAGRGAGRGLGNGDRHQGAAADGHVDAAALRGKWDNDPGADSPGVPRAGDRRGAGVSVKEEREWHDRRRAQDAGRKAVANDPFGLQARPEPGGSSQAAAPPAEEEEEEPKEKEKPNFATSGKLTEDSNTYRGVVIKYSEPSEARRPKRKWRFYVFKGDEALPAVHIHRQSAYLLGRERLVADLPIDHPSCSKQHAVLQHRLVAYQRPDGAQGQRVRPYILDLESSNGTYLNNNRIEASRYYELKEKDVLKFGYSTREYVLLHDQSKDDDPEEDLGED